MDSIEKAPPLCFIDLFRYCLRVVLRLLRRERERERVGRPFICPLLLGRNFVKHQSPTQVLREFLQIVNVSILPPR